MKDFLLFYRMVTPIVIQILFWIGIVCSLTLSIFSFIHMEFLSGLFWLIAAPILLRVGAEVLILLFRINDNLTAIRNNFD